MTSSIDASKTLPCVDLSKKPQHVNHPPRLGGNLLRSHRLASSAARTFSKSCREGCLNLLAKRAKRPAPEPGGSRDGDCDASSGVL